MIDGYTAEEWCNDANLVCVVTFNGSEVSHSERYVPDENGNLMPEFPPTPGDATARIESTGGTK